MAWSSPITWSSSLVTVSQFNQQIRDNMNALKDPPTALHTVDRTPVEGDYTTSSTSFITVDGTNLALSITTAGGDIFVGFVGTVFHSATAGNHRVFFDVTLDGVSVVGDDGICAAFFTSGTAPEVMPVAFVYLIDSPSAGAHTIRLRWRVNSGTVGLYAGAGTSNGNLHPQFWVRELS